MDQQSHAEVSRDAGKPPTPGILRPTDAKKRKDSKSGKQYVANTGPARRARRNTGAVPLTEMPVAEATRHVRDLDAGQLGAALRAVRARKGRRTLIQRLQSALDRR